MLRNAYLDSYKKKQKNKSEYEKYMLNHDGNHVLQQERPLSNTSIRKLPEEILPSFINDIMCNKQTGRLLYPSTFKKHVALYLKQQNYVYKITNLDKKKDFYLYNKNNLENCKNNEERNLSEDKIINYQKQEEVDDIKNNIKSFKFNKLSLMKKLKKKNKKFFKKQPLVDKKLTKLSFRPVNDIRIKGYKKAFDHCLNRSFQNKNFNLPNIELKIDNVFSRLYNNVIIRNKKRNKYNDKSMDEYNITHHEKINSNNDKNTKSPIKELNTLLPSTSNINTINQATNSPKTPIASNKRELIFEVSNINKSLNGKEFTKKITPRMYERCLSLLSGGPKSSQRRSVSCILNEQLSKKKKKYINYYAKLTSKNCFLKKKLKANIIKNNKNKSVNNIDTESINNLILANSKSGSEIINIKKFRDVNYNTNLHVAVLKNSYKFVDYFIKKKLNINKKNKDGDTPLHLAIGKGDYDIIKLLLDNGASIKIKNKKGKTAFDIADKEMRLVFNLEDIYNNSLKY